MRSSRIGEESCRLGLNSNFRKSCILVSDRIELADFGAGDLDCIVDVAPFRVHVKIVHAVQNKLGVCSCYLFSRGVEVVVEADGEEGVAVEQAVAKVHNDILAVVGDLVLRECAIWIHSVATGAQNRPMQLPILRLVNLASTDQPVVPAVFKLLILGECAQVLLIRVREGLHAALNISIHSIAGEDLIVVQLERRVVHDCDQGAVLHDLIVHACCGESGTVAVN